MAYDGPSALKVATSWHPDVALLDIGLPVMDGYELAQQMRGHPELAATTLVAITRYGQPGDRERSRVAGFDAHLVRSVHVEEIRALVQKLTDGEARAGGAEGTAG